MSRARRAADTRHLGPVRTHVAGADAIPAHDRRVRGPARQDGRGNQDADAAGVGRSDRGSDRGATAGAGAGRLALERCVHAGLLAFIARRREAARLLVLGTYRPVEVLSDEHPLQGITQELYAHRLATELPLGVLSEADIAAYLDARLDGG